LQQHFYDSKTNTPRGSCAHATLAMNRNTSGAAMYVTMRRRRVPASRSAYVPRTT
jgi:hypothetical protein